MFESEYGVICVSLCLYSLSSNSIGEVSGKAIGDGLKENKCLQELE